MPLSAIPAGREGRSWSLKRNGDLKLNEVLLHALDAQHGVKLDAERLLPEVQGDGEGEDFDLEPLFAALRAAAKDIAGFAISDRYIVSNFQFQKMAIVRDLRELLSQSATRPIIAGIAGDLDGERRGAVHVKREIQELNAVLPDNEFLVLDSDSTQQQAVAFALAGKNGVISGPPDREEPDDRESDRRAVGPGEDSALCRGKARRPRCRPGTSEAVESRTFVP